MFLYFFACVNLHNGFNIIHPKQHIKKVEPPFNSLHSVGSGLPVSKILKNKPHLSQASLISDIRTNIRELSRFTETDKRKLAFFSIKTAALPCGKTTVQIYINYEYTQTDEIDTVETFHETSLQFQRKDTKKSFLLSFSQNHPENDSFWKKLG